MLWFIFFIPLLVNAYNNHTALRELKPTEERFKVLAKRHNMLMGAAINDGLFGNKNYVSIIKNNYNIVVGEYQCQISNLWPAPGKYNFKLCDKVYSFAKKHKIPTKWHSIAWYNTAPRHKMDTAKLSTYIKKIKSRYGKQIKYYDVINEALEDKKNALRKIKNISHIKNWFTTVFKVAKKIIGKSAKLVYNDYLISSMTGYMSNKANRAFNLIKKNKAFVDVVGFQLHISDKFNYFDGVRQNIRRYAKIGIEVQFSELDVASKPYNPAKQKRVYYELIKICRSEPNCKSIIFWSFSDAKTWIPDKRPGLYDKNFKKKPAYRGVLKALK